MLSDVSHCQQRPSRQGSTLASRREQLSHGREFVNIPHGPSSGIHNSMYPSTHPQISLHSFVLGFVIGCIVVYVVHNVACGSEGCSYDQKQVLVPVEVVAHINSERELSHELSGERHAIHHHKLAQRKLETSVEDSVTGIENGGLARKHVAEGVDTSVVVAEPAGCPDRQLHLIIMVLSAPGGVIRRNAIRGTWLHNYHSGTLKVTSRFLIGTRKLMKERIGNLSVEQSQFGDLLLFDDLKDSYSELSTKVLRGMQWTYDNAMEFDFLVKTDDDSYVRIDQVAKNLHWLKCTDRLYWGYFMGHALPEPSGKWAEYNWFNCPHYLPYAMGGGYVLSRRVVAMVMRFSDRLKLYNNEDVTIGSWLAPFNLLRKHDLRFDVESLSHGCNNNYIITHKERVRSLYEKYTNLLKNGTICEVEKEIRPAYVYNWDVVPTDCCNRTKGLPVTNLV